MSIRRWTDSLNSEESNELYRELSLLFAQRITHPSTRECFVAGTTSNDIRALCDFDPPYGELTAYDAICSRQVSAFYQKRRDLDLGVDQRGAAVRKFIESETLCRETNRLFRLRSEGVLTFPPRVERVLTYAQRKIAEILGDEPSIDDLRFRFGNGALATLPKKEADIVNKLYHRLSCSEDLVPLLGAILEEVPHLVFSPSEMEDETVERKVVDVDVVNARLGFVPKNFKTHRAILVEPMLNSFVQLGIERVMARRLRKFGLDIRDQTRNQRLALMGSITGGLATLDLSSASDTVSFGLVLDLLPLAWFELLDQSRSSCFEYEGAVYRQEKFSSMGNGFTFPLETLIFASLALSCCREVGVDDTDVSVYGDDIIVPTEAYDLLTEVLRVCGFIPNKEKSFASGPFRESCGHDYLSGINVRPCYVKLGAYGPQLFVLHNFFKRSCDEEAALIVRRFISDDVAIFGPDGYGDGHLLGDWLPKPLGREKGWSGVTFETYSLRPRRWLALLPGDYRLPLYSTYVSEGQRDQPNSPGLRTLKNGAVEITIPQGIGDQPASYDRIKIYTLKV